MIILGIDPSLTCLGWGVIRKEKAAFKYLDSGTITTKPNEIMPYRLATIDNHLAQIISLYKPEKIALEETFVNNNAVSSLKLGFVRGAIMSLVGRCRIEFCEYKPNTIKKTVAGAGHAEKAQVLHMIKLLLLASPPLSISSYDEADALAIAYTCALYG